MRCLPFDEAPDKYRAKLENVIKQVDKMLVPADGDRSTLLLDYDTRMRIMETHAKGNAAIARRYFGRDQLFLEQMPAPDEPLAQMVLPTDSAVLMRDYVAPMIRNLIKQYVDTPTKT